MLVAHSFDQFQHNVRPAMWSPPVVTVGNFDGMHLGHQFLVHELVQWARGRQCPAVVVTFVTHPRSFIAQSEVRRLTPPNQKLALMQSMGVDAAVMVEFDDGLRSLTAREFCADVVMSKLGACGLLLGHNNYLGRDRLGTPEALATIGNELGLEVRHASKVEIDGQPISSSAIREHIGRGDFLWARKMLGRPYALRGTATKGRQLGRTIGFPTMNIPLEGVVHPPLGVYGVLVSLESNGRALSGPRNGRWIAAANLGVRPTVETGRTAPLLEVHILGDVPSDTAHLLGDAGYGLDVEVEFAFRVRDEKRFSGIDELRAQLALDVTQVRQKFEHGDAGASMSGRFSAPKD